MKPDDNLPNQFAFAVVCGVAVAVCLQIAGTFLIRIPDSIALGTGAFLMNFWWLIGLVVMVTIFAHSGEDV